MNKRGKKESILDKINNYLDASLTRKFFGILFILKGFILIGVYSYKLTGNVISNNTIENTIPLIGIFLFILGLILLKSGLELSVNNKLNYKK